MAHLPQNISEMINISHHLRSLPLKVIELNKAAHHDLDMELYQNYIIITMIALNVVVGLLYRTLLYRSIWEQGLSPINFLIGNLSNSY